MKKVIILALAVGCSQVSAECETKQTGGYIAAGAGNDLRGNAAFNYRGRLYGGWQFCNGLKIEFRHTSVLGDDDGVDLDGDNQNDIATSENTIGLDYTVWFDK